ncbi:uncharacterized protein LOC124143998 [Haliotis rufescens]|uniref:uncharacterized protein LOC124143998 n=1 Tax=Haliotis rufescens TaxID=6454 RepID=UPI00201EF05B|nr:uncharacterized protein LOC124143998 [Haliotis rufescens]
MEVALILAVLTLGGAVWSDDLEDLYTSLDVTFGIRFLISVNDSRNGSECVASVETPILVPAANYSQSKAVSVGSCDVMSLLFSIKGFKGQIKQVNVTFYSTVIADAEPLPCLIPWNGTYPVPKTTDPRKSPLPGCFIMNWWSKGHISHYWFHILSWVH